MLSDDAQQNGETEEKDSSGKDIYHAIAVVGYKNTENQYGQGLDVIYMNPATGKISNMDYTKFVETAVNMLAITGVVK